MPERALVMVADARERAWLREQLEGAGYGTSSAGTVDETRELLAAQPYAVILLDLDLPASEGVRFCHELRTRFGVRPVLLGITADRQPHRHVVGLELGADDVLVAPIDGAELVARLAAHLRRRPA